MQMLFKETLITLDSVVTWITVKSNRELGIFMCLLNLLQVALQFISSVVLNIKISSGLYFEPSDCGEVYQSKALKQDFSCNTLVPIL